MGMPVHVAHHFKAKTVECFEGAHPRAKHQLVNIKNIAHAVEVALAFGEVVVSMVGDQQWAQTIFQDFMYLIVAVFAATDRYYAVVIFIRA